MAFEQILQSKVGFGRAQIIPFLFLCLVDMNDGAELVLSSFLTPVIKEEWHLSSDMVSLLTAIFYMGILFGSIISGKLADLYGRKILITTGSVMQLAVSSSFAIVNGVNGMILVRFLYGFAFGFTVAITTSMFAESAPSAYRGKGLLLLNFAISLGKLYGVLLASIFLEDFTHGNWRAMMILSSLPNIIVLYGALRVLRQSPRYLLGQHRYFEAFAVIDQMIEVNNGQLSQKLTAKEKDSLEEESGELYGCANSQFKELFGAGVKKTTLALSFCWMTVNFMFYGQLIILPFILGMENKSFFSYVATIMGEAPCLLLSMWLVDKPQFGRKNSMVYFFLASGLFHAIFAFNRYALFSSAARFFMKEVFQMLYPCTTESFGTKMRTMAFGFCSAMGRVGAIIMPYAIFPLLDISNNLIFLLFTVGSILGAIASFSIPKEPCGRPLDEKNVLKEQLIER